MKQQILALSLCVLLFALYGSVGAQQTGKVPRIGFLDPSTASGSAVLLDAFRQELSKLGWIEGKNITVEYRFGENKGPERLPALAAELEDLTPRAAQALPANPFQITQFPFRIGRRSPHPLVYNDLILPDSVPMQISRHHLAFIAHEGRVGVVDRGSSLGSWVDDQKLGGPSGPSGPMFFTGSEGLLVLGSRDCPFRYRVSLHAEVS